MLKRQPRDWTKLAAAGIALVALASVACNGAIAADPSSQDASTGLEQRKIKADDLKAGAKDFETFLDRLMMAESDGRDFLKNPRSTALGAFQFIKGTFLYVTRRHFADELDGMSEAAILALRTDRAFSRRVISVYVRELAQHLSDNGLPTTYGHLRLAYLVGPSGATRVLSAAPTTPVRQVLSAAAVEANPFLAGMTVRDLIARANAEIAMDPSKRLAVAKRKRGSHSGIKVRCHLGRASCRRWLALKKRKLKRVGRNQAANAPSR